MTWYTEHIAPRDKQNKVPLVISYLCRSEEIMSGKELSGNSTAWSRYAKQVNKKAVWPDMKI